MYFSRILHDECPSVLNFVLNAFGLEYYVLNAFRVEYFVLNDFGVEWLNGQMVQVMHM